MSEYTQKLSLKPFSAENAPDNCRINAVLTKKGTSLKVVFELTAGSADLIIPVFQPAGAQRKEKLWEHTCFEIFLAQSGMPKYWEFNLSPSGDWNIYTFSGYREGMKQEICFHNIPFEVIVLSRQALKLETSIDLKVLEDCSGIDVGLSTVLEQSAGAKSYWALNHPGDIPDFHARKGWLKSF